MYQDHITVAGILERLLRHPLLRDLSYADASFYAVECLNNIGSLSLLSEKGSFIDVENYKGVLPIDFVTTNSQLNGIRRIDNSNDTFTSTPMYPATGQFHVNYSKDDRYYKSTEALNTYTISGRVITTGFESGKIEVSYYGLATTDTGEILIPRHPFVIKAIEEYIKQEYFRILYDLDKIKYNTYAKAEQEYLFAVAKASNAGKALNIADRNNLSNMLTRLISTDNDYEFGFRDTFKPGKSSISTSDDQIITSGPIFVDGIVNVDEIDGGDATT